MDFKYDENIKDESSSHFIINQLQREISEFKKYQQENENLKIKISQLEYSLNNCVKEKKSLEEELNEKSKKNLKKYTEIKSSYDMRILEIEDKDKQINSLFQNLDHKEILLKKKSDEYEAFENSYNDLKNSIKDLKGQLSKNKEEYDAVRRLNEDLENQNDRLNKYLQNNVQQNKEKEDKNIELLKIKDDYEVEIKLLDDKITELNDEKNYNFQILTEYKQKLENSYNSKSRMEQELITLKNDYKGLESSLKDTYKLLNDFKDKELRTEIQMDKMIKDKYITDNDNETLNNNMKNQQQTIVSLNMKINTLNSEIQILRQTNDKYNIQNQEIVEEIDNIDHLSHIINSEMDLSNSIMDNRNKLENSIKQGLNKIEQLIK